MVSGNIRSAIAEPRYRRLGLFHRKLPALWLFASSIPAPRPTGCAPRSFQNLPLERYRDTLMNTYRNPLESNRT